MFAEQTCTTTISRTLPGLLVAVLLLACSVDPSELTGRWVVSLPYGWQDQFLRDHCYELQMNDDGTYVQTQRWAEGTNVSRGKWRALLRGGVPEAVVLQPLHPAQGDNIIYTVRRRGLGGVRLQFSASPDHALCFRRS